MPKYNPDGRPRPETLYTHGAEGRETVGFREEIMALVREVLTEEQENA